MESIAIELPSPLAPANDRAARASTRPLNLALFLFAIVPAALIVRLISEYGVNAPYGDEWALVPLFAKWGDHQLTFADLFRQHNEHRIFFPKLLYIAFAQLTHWNLRAEMFFSVFLCAITSACIYGLLRQTVAGSTGRSLTIWALINLLIFSPSQIENWLWGFQFATFIPTLCLVAALLVLNSPTLNAIRFFSACALALVATFSFGNGLLLWPVIGVHLLLRTTSKRWLVWWSVAFILTATLFFIGYQSHPSPGRQPATALDYIIYFFRFNGNAFGQLPVPFYSILTALIGACAIFLFVGTIALFLKWRDRALVAAAPWIALGTFGLASALLVTCARVHEGIEQALDSRYSSVSINLFIALIALFAILSDSIHHARFRFSKLAATCTPFLMAALLVCYAAIFPGSLGIAENLAQVRTHGLANLAFAGVIPPSGALREELRIHTGLAEFLEDVATIQRLNLLDPTLRHSNLLYDSANQPYRSTDEFGRCDNVIRKSSSAFEMSGWAFLPELHQPAHSVVLAYESGGRWLGFALAEVNKERPDAVKKFGSAYNRSGWRRVVDTAGLPKNARQISAWAADGLSGDVFKLPGTFSLPPP